MIYQSYRSKPLLIKPLCKFSTNPPLPSSSDAQVSVVTVPPAPEKLHQKRGLSLKGDNARRVKSSTVQLFVVARRHDAGGVEGPVITLLANHFLVKFKPSQQIFHYNVEISPNPSKDVARMIKNKLVKESSAMFWGVIPSYDGRKNLYSPVEFLNNKLEFYISLPIHSSKSLLPLQAIDGSQLKDKNQQLKLFRIIVKLVS